MPAATELPARAVTARLTLQLRAATRDADAAEEAEAAVDAEAARLQLRERLNPMLEDRRRVLQQALVAEQAEAAALVADTRRQAAEKSTETYELAWASAVPAVPAVPALPEATAGLDPAAMATLFTSVAGKLLDERLERLLPAPEPKKPSFWKHLFHTDVVIVGLIMVFCLVVVVSWMS